VLSSFSSERIGKDRLRPLEGKEAHAPVLKSSVTVSMATSLGAVTIEVYPDAAPRSARRFLKLAASGYYDDIPVHRVVDGFAAQLGINWREPHKRWQTRAFKDDPVYFRLERGTVTFAKTERDKATTEVIIHLRDNSRLAGLGFAPFARVVRGMEVVDAFAQVGDPNLGLDASSLWADGDTFLHSLREKPTTIDSMVVVDAATFVRDIPEEFPNPGERSESRH
jgi:cyclophilin family peptidyl-prolyl cis-trans isomerase